MTNSSKIYLTESTKPQRVSWKYQFTNLITFITFVADIQLVLFEEILLHFDFLPQCQQLNKMMRRVRTKQPQYQALLIYVGVSWFSLNEKACYPFKLCSEFGDLEVPSNKDYQKECK